MFPFLFLFAIFSRRFDSSTGIKIKLKGKGKVEWSEDGTETYDEDGETKTRTVTEYYRNKEEYFETKMHLFGTGYPLMSIEQTFKLILN